MLSFRRCRHTDSFGDTVPLRDELCQTKVEDFACPRLVTKIFAGLMSR